METGERTTVFAQMWQPTIIKQPLFITVLEITWYIKTYKTIYRLAGDVLIHV